MRSSFESARLRSAAKRFEERANRPVRAAEGFAEPAAERRKAFLSRGSAQSRAAAASAEAEVHGAPRSRQADTLASLARERIINKSDLLDVNYLELAIAVARAVCRIRLAGGAGTGFLVGPGVLLTNHHVFETQEDARDAEAQFDYQENRNGDLLPVQSFRLDPARFFVTDETLDFTLVAVDARSQRGIAIESYPWLKLIGTLGKVAEGEAINIIQHPRGGLKQIALRNNEIIRIPEGKRDFLYYTTDTEPGSSGSPALNDQWELVALHHSGVPRTRDGRVLRKDGQPWREGADDPALIDWIANEGARVSAIVDAIEAEPLAGAPAELRKRLLEETPPNPVELARIAPSGAERTPAPAPVPAFQQTSFTVPLTITFSLGAAAAPVAVSPGLPAPQPLAAQDGVAAGVASGAAEKVQIDPDWKTRHGYDADFLGRPVPLPRLSQAIKQQSVKVPVKYRVGGDEYALAYHHYSLVMNAKRRFAWYSAANVDGDRRPKLPPRKDRWFIDPRIDDPAAPRFQCGEDLYAAGSTDRGHLTRYLDVAWGDAREEALLATGDTFHFTNCCLQLSGFNQGKSRWQGIEQYLLENKARKEARRISVITGPIFRDTDPRYQNEFMDSAVRIPLQFWKVCALVREDGSLAATGFVLGQEDVADLPGFEEAFDVTATQVTLRELEHRTGLDFGVLTDNDHFAKIGVADGTLEMEGRRVRPLRALEDIVV